MLEKSVEVPGCKDLADNVLQVRGGILRKKATLGKSFDKLLRKKSKMSLIITATMSGCYGIRADNVNLNNKFAGKK